MHRAPTNQKTDGKIFSYTAQGVNRKNLTGKIMRGGTRL